MSPEIVHSLWQLTEIQHGVLSRQQLLDAGLTPDAIRHRLEEGRLHRVYAGVYAVGRPELSQLGRWMAAVLACGEGAVLSHASAAALWGVYKAATKRIDISVPKARRAAHAGIRPHRRTLSREETTTTQRIPVTAISMTLVDLAAVVTRKQLEAAINEADKLDLITPHRLRDELDRMPTRRGIRVLRVLLEETSFTLTDSELERRFLPIAKRAGLPPPKTQARIHGFRVDFHWPDVNLVVETDGLRYHRTPQQQAKDRIRDQRLTVAGLTVLRFTHSQIAKDPAHVGATLVAVVEKASSRSPAAARAA